MPLFPLSALQPLAGRTFAVCSALLTCSMFVPASLSGQNPAPAQLTISPQEIVSPVSPMLYGMMTEEINHAFEGGLYAELVQNRTMRASWSGVEHWDLVRRGEAKASLELDKNDGPSKALPTSLSLTVTEASAGNEAGVSNTGYWGMGIKPHTKYIGSFYAKADAAGPVRAQVVSDTTGAVLGEATVDLKPGGWSKYDYAMTTGAVSSGSANHLVLLVAHPAKVSFQLVSLFPPTYKNQSGGFRPDLMEKMYGLHPYFLRLPGGNYLEGDTLRDWYNWKETIGPLVDRPGHQAPWSYWSDDGMGLLEMLEWTEQLHIEPILAVYAGYALQGEKVKAGPDLEPYVQSAVDEVEYVTGDTSTKWGAQRAKDGHPAPFPLHFIEIGNEDFLERGTHTYNARFAQFAKALRQKYPQYKLIATMPVEEGGADLQPDVVDDHYYKPVGEMLDFTHHYDNAPRTGPKIFVGEWATLDGTPTPNLGRRPGRCGMDDLYGAQQRSDCHGGLCAAVHQRQPRRRPVVHQHDRLRRKQQLWVAELLRTGSLRQPSRRWNAEELHHGRRRAVLLLSFGRLQGPCASHEAGQRIHAGTTALHRSGRRREWAGYSDQFAWGHVRSHQLPRPTERHPAGYLHGEGGERQLAAYRAAADN